MFRLGVTRLSFLYKRTYSAAGVSKKLDFLNLSIPQLEGVVETLSNPRFRANQICQWVYRQGVESYDDMKNLPKTLIEDLKIVAPLGKIGVEYDQTAEDGTRKWGLKLSDGAIVESVFIPDADRGTVCVSSQAGCSVGCSFCATGAMGAGRNLTTGEILAQFHHVRRCLGDYPLLDGKPRRANNIVFMGMGEPLYNVGNVEKAVLTLSNERMANVGKRHITISTSGVVPHIPRATALGVRLAISLHAVTDELRDTLVPINKQWPLAELMKACHAATATQHRISFEYCILKGVNDDLASARALPKLLSGIPSLVNIMYAKAKLLEQIPFNRWPGSNYECPDDDTVQRFADTCRTSDTSGQMEVTIRWPRGRDIQAACGQLSTTRTVKERPIDVVA